MEFDLPFDIKTSNVNDMQLRDLSPQKDPKGGSPKTPPGGISVSQFTKMMEAMTKGEAACVTLEKHFDMRLEEMDRRLTDAQNNAKEAIKVATAAQERRLDLLNEFRGQAGDEAKKYALRETVDGLRNQVSLLFGGVTVVGIIGVANLVKLFLAH